jgi:hypothetical protein
MNNTYYLTSEIDFETTKIIDIWKKFQFKNFTTNDYIYYNVKNGEIPELISYNYYGTTDYWWIVLLFNDIFDPFFEWPISQNDLEQYVKDNTENYQINPDYYTNLETAKEENETNRTIKLPKKNIIDKIIIDIINHYK